MSEEEKQKPRRSLNDYFQIMREFDEDLLDLTIEEFSQMVNEDLPEKVDGCKKHIDHIESRIEDLKNKKDSFQAAQKSVNNAKKSFKDYLVYAMDNGKVTKVKGNTYTLSLQSRTTIAPKDFEINTDIFMEFNNLVYGSVKRTYSIDAGLFKLLCEKHAGIKAKYAVEKTTKSPVFRVRKDK